MSTSELLDLKGKRALVVGGSSGIGNGIAQTLANAGADTHVTGRRTDPQSYSRDEGSNFDSLVYHAFDASDENGFKQLGMRFDHLDILVNSVGTVAYNRAEYEIDTFRHVVEVNLVATMHCCVQFHDLLSAAAGSIVNIGSTSSYIATPGQPAYSASKGALLTLTKSLACAWAKNGIRVNGIAPGFVETKLTAISRGNSRVYDASVEKIPLKRWGTPEEMGNAVLFLVSPMASYITGQMLLVDGGITLS